MYQMRMAATIALAGLLLAFGVSRMQAQQAVIVTVDGAPITAADLTRAEADVGHHLGNLSGEARTVALIEYLIRQQLLAAAARSEGLDSGESYRDGLRYYQRRALFEQYVVKHVGPVERDEVKRHYDFEAAAYKPVEEVRARLIQIESQLQAVELRAEILKGGDFSKVAQAKSQDRATNWLGGDLGYFIKGEMKPWIEAQAFALKPGTVSEPLKVEQGWYLIKVEDRRMRAFPAFEDIKDQLRHSLIERKIDELTNAFRKKATVKVTSPQN